MRIKSLHLKNIGPFEEADLEFYDGRSEPPPVVLITGENGTGKSIILDAIRGVFGKQYGKLERDLRRRGAEDIAHVTAVLANESELELSLNIGEQEFTLPRKQQNTEDPRWRIQNAPSFDSRDLQCPDWVVDCGPPVLAKGAYAVQSLRSPNHKGFLQMPLAAEKSKTDITQLICHFDYLRDSRDADERATGELLFSVLERIIEASLLDGGRFSHVARATYEPMVIQNDMEVSLSQLVAVIPTSFRTWSICWAKCIPSISCVRRTTSELCNTPEIIAHRRSGESTPP
ncbi:MAG: AAA family ATPase [Caldilineaceae bacterium]